jgi:glutamine---fructose-6-phosphate transaminase (isomerizing)
MCGIIGYIGGDNAVPILIEGLKRLEYRGYDSAGIAVINDAQLTIRKAVGKLKNLEEVVGNDPPTGTIGIGHTRWATHGRVTELNAHPHEASGFVLVHNGIIENYLALKEKLSAEGHEFRTETDTEVIVHLIAKHFTGDLTAAVHQALQEVVGAYAIAVLSTDDPNTVVGARSGCPLVVGLGQGAYFLASDVPAVLNHTREVIFLDDGEVATLTREGVRVSSLDGQVVAKDIRHVTWDPIMAEKGGYKHFMLKEIFEQPMAVKETVLGRASVESGRVFLHEIQIPDEALRGVERIVILACGTSWHSGLVGKFLFEKLARVPVDVDYGSEYRYRDPIVSNNTLTVVITQSGETADTLAALREARKKGARTIAICNVVGSMATRETDGTVYTHAGPEIGVASTKAFTSQLVALHLLAMYLGQIRGTLKPEEARPHVEALTQLPLLLEQTLKCEPLTEEIARRFYERSDFLYLGRGINYPIALEGALKLKEISYIHAEGYPAGEMKHGPIALIDEHMPVVTIAPHDHVYEKMIGNIQEAKARGGSVVALTTEGNGSIRSLLDPSQDFLITVPDSHPLLTPVLMVVPLQLLAYHIAIRRGCDVDQPRNLAKSVTVE